jgi:uncharacterized protein YecT (DUF1311 family)
MRICVCILAVMALATPAVAKLAVADRTMGKSTPKLTLDVHYPVTGRPALDRLFADYVRARIKEVGQPEAGEDHEYSVDVGYQVLRNDDQFFSVGFSVEEYSGGAHPIHFDESFHFLMPDGARTFLPELVDGQRGLAKISRLATADLTKRLLAKPDDAMTNADWIKGGTTPAQLAQIAFDWQPKTLALRFGEYAVAPYAAGPQEVHIPMSAIADVVRADPRAPMASFDCAKAGSAIEKSVCASAALARLDRQVSEAYAIKRDSDHNPKARLAVLEEQRTFLAARDKACGSGNAACLTDAYRKRLAALQPT